MIRSIEVLFSPAEYSVLADRNLSGTACVVLDILRATTTMMTALANGAEGVIPVLEISEAVALKEQRPDVLLAGERNGLRIGADQAGGTDFDLGNSPREFTPERVRGKTIVMTTTNGTRALRACAHADTVLIGAFLNLRAVVNWVRRELPTHLARDDDRDFAHDAAFPLKLVFNRSRHRYAEPWYFGLCRGMAYAQVFRATDRVRLTQSPSGGGAGNPAWDFQWFIADYQVGRRY